MERKLIFAALTAFLVSITMVSFAVGSPKASLSKRGATEIQGNELTGTSGDLTFSARNRAEINGFWHYCDCPLGYPSSLFEGGGTLMIGLITGNDTIVYHNVGPAPEHPIPDGSEFSPIHTTANGYHTSSHTFMTTGGEVAGKVEYFFDKRNWIDEEYFLVRYTLTNPGDTAIKICSGQLCNFDISNQYGSYAGYDSLDRMIWQSDYIDSEATAIKLLSGSPGNLRALSYSTVTAPIQTIHSGVAYGELTATSNYSEPLWDNWMALVSFGEATLAPGESVSYTVALLYSQRGVPHLHDIIETIAPVADSGDIEALPLRIRNYRGLADPTELTDTFLVINRFDTTPVSWSATNTSSWLQLLQTSGISGDTLHMSYNSTGLSLGTYSDTITVSAPLSGNKVWRSYVQLKIIPGSGIITVPGQRSTIESAISTAVDGDRIVVDPGTYPVNLNFLGKAIKLVSSSGPEATILTNADTTLPIMRMNNGENDWAQLSGFTINVRGKRSGWPSGIIISQDVTAKITDNILTGYSGIFDLISCDRALPTISHNLFTNFNGLNYCVGIGYGSSIVTQNTVDHCQNGFYSWGQEGIFRNNLVTNCTRFGIVQYGADLSCNDSWNNHTNYDNPDATSPTAIPAGNLSVNPLYCSPQNNVLTLLESSPCAPANSPCGELIGVYDVGCSSLCGDADGSGIVNISDVVYLISYIFTSGPAPNPLSSGDANNDQAVNISDVVYLIAYIFAGGKAPCQAPK